MPSFKSPKEPAQGHLQATLNSMAEAHHNGQSCLPLTLNGHTMQDAGHYPTGNPVKDGEYFLSLTAMEEEQLRQQASQAEAMMRSQDLPEEVNGRVRAAIGKSNLLINQKFEQFRELCQQHMHQDPTDRVPLWEDLQGFWDMIKIQVDNVEDMFAEIQHMSENGWKEIPKQPSRRSSASSSPKSGSLSQTSTPSATPGHTPGSKRKGLKPNNKDTPDSSPERTQKARSTAKARDEARKKLLAEKRAAMKQQQQEAGDIEIYVPETK